MTHANTCIYTVIHTRTTYVYIHVCFTFIFNVFVLFTFVLRNGRNLNGFGRRSRHPNRLFEAHRVRKTRAFFESERKRDKVRESARKCEKVEESVRKCETA